MPYLKSMISGNVKNICSFHHLISKLWFEHFCIFWLFYIWPSHLLKSFISDLESLRKIQSQSLCSIGEDVKGNFGSFSLHVGDESLQICSSFYLKMIKENLMQVRATLESSSKRGSFDRISSRQEFWNFENWKWD